MAQVKRKGVKLPHMGGKGNVGIKDVDSSFVSVFNFFLAIRKEANIFSDYSLCASVPVEKLVVQPTSLYTLSIAEIRLIASPSSAVKYLGSILNPQLVVSPTSAYSLSTAPT